MRARMRQSVSHGLCALLTFTAFTGAGCAGHTRRPAPEERLGSLQGKTVRAVCKAGDVELTVSRYSYPYMTGACRRSSSPQLRCRSPIVVDVRECARIEQRRLDGPRAAAARLLGVLAVVGGVVSFGLLIDYLGYAL